MTEKVAQEVLARLDKLAEKMGEAGAYSWAVLVRQAFWVDGVVSLAVSVLGLCLSIGLSIICRHCWVNAGAIIKESGERYCKDEETKYVCGAIFAGLAWIALFIAAIVGLTSSVGPIINPEYYALRELLSALK